jgi:hypothetical protein
MQLKMVVTAIFTLNFILDPDAVMAASLAIPLNMRVPGSYGYALFSSIS